MDFKQFWGAIRARAAKAFADDPLEALVVSAIFAALSIGGIGVAVALVVSAVKAGAK
jgi:hypothetical protein